ncbi:MAG: transporter accessory protein [Longicatena sp.]
MKKIIPLCIILLLFGCSAKPAKQNEKKNACDDGENSSCAIVKSADMSAYEGFTSKDNQFVVSTMDDVLKTLKDKGNAFVYLGYPKCPWCIDALPIVNEEAKKAGVHIQYVETRDSDKKLLYTDEQKKTLIPYVEPYLNKDDKAEDGSYKLFVPFFFVIKEGKVVSGHIGTVDSHDATKGKMSENEEKEFTKIIEKMLKDYK